MLHSDYKKNIYACGQDNCLLKELEGSREIKMQRTFFHKGECLYMPRVAWSWSKWTHEYRVDLKRERNIDDRVLSRLMLYPHPNLLRLIKYCRCLMKVEYIEGYILELPRGPVFSIQKEKGNAFGKFGLDEFNEIREKVIAALKHLHSIGLAHTDPCPSNVMITRSGEVKLIDLGEIVPITNGEDELDWMILEKKLKYKFTWREKIHQVLITDLLWGSIRYLVRLARGGKDKADYIA